MSGTVYMKQEAYVKTLEWLKTNPALDELCAKFPADWVAVQQDISAIVERGVAEELKAYLEHLSQPLEKSSFGNQQAGRDMALSQFVRSRMAHESVKKLSLSVLAADTGVR